MKNIFIIEAKLGLVSPFIHLTSKRLPLKEDRLEMPGLWLKF